MSDKLRVKLQGDGTTRTLNGIAPGTPGSEAYICHVCSKPGHNAGFVGAVYVGM